MDDLRPVVSITEYWWAWHAIVIVGFAVIYVVGEFLVAWLRYRRRWKVVKPHYGSVYDGRMGKPQPRVWRA